MRRRRNVATAGIEPGTPVADSPVETNAPAETSQPVIENPPSTEASVEATTAPSRSRRVRTASRRESTPAEAPITEPSLEPEPVASPEPRTRRSSRRRTPAGETEAPPEEVVAAPTEEAPKPTRSRRTRKPVTPPTTEVIAETAPVVESPVVEPSAVEPLVEEPSTTVVPVLEELAPAPPTPSRRSRRRSSEPQPTAEAPAPTEPVALPEPIVVPAQVVPVLATSFAPAEVAPSGQRRTRGLRIPTSPRSTVAFDVPPAVEVVDEAATKKRVRGLRRSVTPRVLGETVSPVVAPLLPEVTRPVPVEVTPAYKPLVADVLEHLPKGEIRRSRNLPALVIADEVRQPTLFFVNTEDTDGRETAVRQIRLAYESGIRLFSLLAHLPWVGKSGERRYETLDEALELIAENAPEAFVMPRLIFSPPTSWVKVNEGEMTRYEDGETGDVSIASASFWEQEAVFALRAAVEHAAQSPHASRVFGFYLEHGEWFYEKGRGYDYSEANEKAFRAWLRQKYNGNQIALRASWCDGVVTFDTAPVPPAPSAEGPTLFFSSREQRWADYHEFASDIVADVIIRLGETVKEASGGRSLVAVSYGYTLELARAGSGHLALGPVLDSEAVDILTGPLSYNARTPGGSAPLPVPLDSIHLAGKLYVSEDDTKTYLANEEDTPDTYNPKFESFEDTWSAHSRNFGAALARGAGVSWMDLWGMGWLDDRELWNSIGRLRSIGESISDFRRGIPEDVAGPDVAVLIDERAFFDVRDEQSLLGKLITAQRDTLLRSGAKVGFYLLSDLTRPDFPKSAKLLLFLNAFHLPDNLRIAIREKYQDGGRTLAWVYGPGCREDSLSELTDVIGLQLRLQPWGSKTGTTVLSNVRSPLSDGIRGQRFGEETRINPSFYVVDTKAEVLGEYGNGNPSLAYRKHPRWQSVFVGETSLPMPLLRGLYRLAGVPIYAADDDVAWVGDRLICLHSGPGGDTTVYLPEEAALYDLLNDEVLTRGGYGGQFPMPPRGTRLLFHGTPDEIRALGGEPDYAPYGLSKDDVPTATTFVFDEAALPPMPDILPDEPDLMASALLGDVAVPDKDDEEADLEGDEETGDGSAADARKRRRRRRRGRGKAGDEATTESSTEETGSTITDETGGESLEDVLAADPPGPRRPSLEELLPLSDVPQEGELPPIPDEFLPLDPLALGGEEEEAGRRRRPRRGRSRSSRENTETATVVEAEATVVDRPVSMLLGLLPLDSESPEVVEEAPQPTEEPTEEPLAESIEAAEAEGFVTSVETAPSLLAPDTEPETKDTASESLDTDTEADEVEVVDTALEIEEEPLPEPTRDVSATSGPSDESSETEGQP